MNVKTCQIYFSTKMSHARVSPRPAEKDCIGIEKIVLKRFTSLSQKTTASD